MDRRLATGACCHRCAAASPASAAVAVSAGADHACAVSLPVQPLAAPSVPTCSSIGCRDPPAAFRKSAGCSGRSTCPCTGPTPFLLSPLESASRSAFPCADQLARYIHAPGAARAIGASSDPLPRESQLLPTR